MADGVGFEPTMGSHPCRVSRPVHSTALPPIRYRLNSTGWQINKATIAKKLTIILFLCFLANKLISYLSKC